MKSLLALLGSTILFAACSSQSDLQDLSLPTGTPMHIRDLDPQNGGAPYIVTVWGIPAVITDDFVPG